MASKISIVLIIVSIPKIIAYDRVYLNNRLATTLSQTGDTEVSVDIAADASIPAVIGRGRIPAPTPTSSDHKLKAITVITTLLLLTIVVTVLIRKFLKSRTKSEENEHASIEIGSVGPERPTNDENGYGPIENVGPERPLYEPRPTVINNEVTIFCCNFPLSGLPF